MCMYSKINLKKKRNVEQSRKNITSFTVFKHSISRSKCIENSDTLMYRNGRFVQGLPWLSFAYNKAF